MQSQAAALAALNELHQRYDGPIPPYLLELAQHGSPEAVALGKAISARRYFRREVHTQADIIRERRIDGSLTPGMVDDFLMYARAFRAANRRVRQYRAIIAEGSDR
jgi:hypothetical protein